MFRQRMAIIAPFDASNAVCEDILPIGFIPTDHIASLLYKFSQVANMKPRVAVYAPYLTQPQQSLK
jgi:hypothetical protein